MANKFTYLTGSEGASPATPGTGDWRFYFKTDGFYIMDDAGTEVGPFGSFGPSGEVHVQVRNETGGTLSKGTPVYASGYNVGADLVEVAAADATDGTTMPCIGLVEEDIASAASGNVVTLGLLENFDTSSFAVADLLFVSETAGALTATLPTGSARVQQVAEVLRSNASTGAVLVQLEQTTETGFAATLLDDGDVATARATLGDAVSALGSVSGTVTPDPENGNRFTATLTGNITVDLTNLTSGQPIVMDLTQDGTGSRTVGFTQTVEWPGGSAFTHTGTANSRDRIVLDFDGTIYTGEVVGQNYS